MFRQLLKRIIYPHSYNNEVYISWLKSCGIKIGEGCKIWSPNQTHIDVQRPHMLHIGNYVKIARNVTILTHDYSRSVCAQYAHINVGEGKFTWIGDNVFIGVNSTILMGTHIGDNSIIGAGAIVHGNFPDGVVIAGNPAKVIMTIEEYIENRKARTLSEAVLYANNFEKHYGKSPSIDDMGNAFSWLYLPHTRESIDKYYKFFKLSGVNREEIEQGFLDSEPVFTSFEEFLNYARNNPQ